MIYLVSNQNTLFDYPENLIRKVTVQQSLKALNKGKTIGLDTETTGLNFLDDKINLVQMGNFKHQFVIDTTTVDILKYKEVLENPNIEKILANAKFDVNFLSANGIFVNNVYDVMLVDFILNNGRIDFYRSLKDMLKLYLDVEISKEEREHVMTDHMSLASIVYAANDVKYLELLKNELEKEVKRTKVTGAVSLENNFVLALSYLEYSGAYVDKAYWIENTGKNVKKLNKVKRNLNEYVIKNHPEFTSGMLDMFSGEQAVDINWNSSKQVIPILEKEGININVYDPKDRKMKKSMAEPVLSKYKGKNKLCDLLLEFSGLFKLISTYGLTFLDNINSKTKRIHSDYRQMVSTGRLSSSRPNLQNIPKKKEFRDAFTNQFPNTVLINADYSGQESVVVANYSKDSNLINFYKSGSGDLHSYVAKRVYKEELKDIKETEVKSKRPDLRQKAKEANFGIMYGMDAYGMHKKMDIPLKEADYIEKSFFNSFPGLKVYFKNVLDFALKYGYIPLSKITNRRFYIDIDKINKLKEDFKNTDDPYIKKELDYEINEVRKLCQNMPIQGSSAEITKLAIILIFNYIKTKGLINVVKLSLTVHDEILCEVPINIAKDIAKVVEACMAKAGTPYCDIIPLEAKPCISNYWDHD